jgi:hypothetical protein
MDPFVIILEDCVTINTPVGARGSVVVMALYYKSEGRCCETGTNEIYIYICS